MAAIISIADIAQYVGQEVTLRGVEDVLQEDLLNATARQGGITLRRRIQPPE